MFSFQYIKCGFPCVRFILYSYTLSSSTITDIIQCKEKTLYKNVAYPVGCHAICNVHHKVHRPSSDRDYDSDDESITIVILITASTVIIIVES